MAQGYGLRAQASCYVLNDLFPIKPQYVDNFNVYGLPCANPDGYMYSRTDERHWRKSRKAMLAMLTLKS